MSRSASNGSLEKAPTGRTRSGRPERPAWVRGLRDWIVAVGIAVVIVVLLQSFVVQLSTVKSISMQPTLYEREWLVVNKVSYELGHPKRGDVAILRDPENGPEGKMLLVKRVIGVPGDTVEAKDGQLYVNGELQVEPYTDAAIEDGDFAPVTVSPKHYFVMGDNRHLDASMDSRSFGEVPEKLFKGRADFIVWPIARGGRL